MIRTNIPTLFVSLTTIGLMLIANPSFAQTHYNRNTTGIRGKTTSTQGTITKIKGGWNRNQTTTGANGNKWNTNANVSGVGTGTVNRNVLRTGPKGNTSTTDQTITRTDNGLNGTSTKTNWRGKSRTSIGSITRSKQ